LAIALVPLRQLLAGNSVGILSVVEAADESRVSRGTAANIEGPADQGSVLVRVEDDGGSGVEGDALLSDLEEKSVSVENSWYDKT
jgi:hypothetical protein